MSAVSRRSFMGLVASFAAVPVLRIDGRNDTHIALVDESGNVIAESQTFGVADFAPFRAARFAKETGDFDLKMIYAPEKPCIVRYAKWKNLPVDMRWMTKSHDLTTIHMYPLDKLDLTVRLRLNRSVARDIP